jgi:hypothetical protein
VQFGKSSENVLEDSRAKRERVNKCFLLVPYSFSALKMEAVPFSETSPGFH